MFIIIYTHNDMRCTCAYVCQLVFCITHILYTYLSVSLSLYIYIDRHIYIYTCECFNVRYVCFRGSFRLSQYAWAESSKRAMPIATYALTAAGMTGTCLNGCEPLRRGWRCVSAEEVGERGLGAVFSGVQRQVAQTTHPEECMRFRPWDLK